TRAYVLDRRLRPVAIGVVGELYLDGAGLARGYLGRPRRTAEGFVPNPFRREPERRSAGRLYRTGDLVRRLPDGVLEFLGRIDHQVKIRGFRIELGEIEAALGRHPAVGEAVVLAREGDSAQGDKRLVAFLAPSPQADEGPPDAGALRGFLKQTLPDYMVPAVFVVLPALPLTPNGKVDRIALGRQALSASERDPVDSEAAFGAPRTPTEEVLAGIWSRILGPTGPAPRPIGVGENFFELGGHSLLATRVISRVREAFGVEIPVRQLFETPTVAGLAEIVEKTRGEGRALAVPPLLPIPRVGGLPRQPVPLSFAQERLWFLDQLDPGSSTYNIPTAVRLAGRIEIPVLMASLREIVRRHEVLRTTFTRGDDGSPVQVISSRPDLQSALVDLRSLAAPALAAESRRLATREARRPFDLTRGPLLRVTLLRLAEAEHVMLFTIHHIASDGWSMGVLQRELAVLFGAFSAGRPSPLNELPVQYADFAHWQRRWLAGEVLEAQLDYWRRQLAGAPARLELPTDRPRPAVQSYRGRSLGVALPEELSGALA
ncbi:MAG: AMP-binding protein, partial [bacterium]|nr:AMP-binding protein [bacterium]